jgi:hypothetical protein
MWIEVAPSNGRFTAKERRAVMKYFFIKANSTGTSYHDMSVTLGDKCPSCSTAKDWVDGFGAGHWSTESEECSGRPTGVTVPQNVDVEAGFSTGHWSTECEECSGWPTGVTVPQNVDVIHSMILDDRRISAEAISEVLAISWGRVSYIIHEILDKRKLSAKLVPKYLSAVRSVLTSQDILDRFRLILWDFWTVSNLDEFESIYIYI